VKNNLNQEIPRKRTNDCLPSRNFLISQSIPVLILIFSIIIISIYINILLKITITEIIIYILISPLIIISIFFNNNDKILSQSYIQSGDGGVAILSIFLTGFYISKNPIIIFGITFITILIFSFFTKKILITKKKENIFSGGILNLSIIIIFFPIIENSKNTDFFYNIIYGLSGTVNLNHTFLITLAIMILPVFILTFIFKDYIKNFSFNKKFFNLTGLNYRLFELFFLTMRSIIMTFIIIITGLFGGIIPFEDNFSQKWNSKLLNILLIILFFQVILLLKTVTLNIPYFYILLLIVSYVAFLIKQSKEIVT
jgi:hypothetical protein